MPPPVQGPQFQVQPWQTLPVAYPATAPTVAPTTAGAAPGTFTDDFNRADSATTLGSPWVTFGGGTSTANNWDQSTWGISSNTAYLVNAVTDGIGDLTEGLAYIETGAADGQLDLDLVSVVALDMIAGFRMSGHAPGGVVANRSYFAVATNRVWRLDPGSGGTATGPTFSPGFGNGDHLTVVLAGSTITVKRNGSTVASFTDTNYMTATKHGLAANDTSNRYDNFSWVPAATRGWVVGAITLN